MRYVLLDQVDEHQPRRRVVARQTFGADDEYLQDHFPSMPLVPGALLIEMMAQAAGWALLAEPLSPDASPAPPVAPPDVVVASASAAWRFPFLVLVGSAKFRRPVLPGEELRTVAEIERHDAQAAEAAVRVTTVASGEVVASARLTFALRPVSDATRPALAAWVAATWQRLRSDRTGKQVAADGGR